jgi:signal transduction histidine kinase
MTTLAILGRWAVFVDVFVVHNGVLGVGFGALAWVTIPSQPRNGAVWALAWASFFGGLFAAGAAAVFLLAPGPIVDVLLQETGTISPADFPLPAAIALQPLAWAYIPAFLLVITLGLLLFPDGRPPSPRWSWVGWYSLATIAVAVGGSAVLASPTSTVAIDSYGGTAGGVFEGAMTLAMAGALASVASLIFRYRRSSGVARRQIRWIAWGGSFLVATLALSTIFEGATTSGDSLSAFVVLGGEALLILSFWVAITKYRLYDIDVVISKTVTYLSLAVVIVVLYGTAVLSFIFLFGDSDQRGGDLGLALPLGATALVAIAFEPIRLRLQRWANGLAYGKRAAPYEVLSKLTAQVADSSGGQGLAGLAGLLREGTGAESAVVWLRVGERLRAEAASPVDAMPSPSEIGSEDDLPGSEVELSVPVRHGGELLGALSITKPRAHSVTPADEDLLADVAAGAGLLLRNLRLNAELAERALQLQASRRRLIAAHDAARHRLERDLHDGAQQQVVALKVKLGLARTIAEKEGADDLAAKVADLADQTQVAVDAMRIVARGIYPPLLEAEGLGSALATAHHTVNLPIQIDSRDLPRYSRQVEETVYFCVVAAVGRAEMAGATSAHVNVQGDDVSLTLSVSYDSADDGNDLTRLTDRIDAFGGTMTTACSEEGTTLTVQLPVAGEVMEPV